MAKTVVILGGSYAGLQIAHYLLKQKIPDVKVILVSKSSHFYWNMASVRAIVPGQITDEQLFQPLAAALGRYPADSYELIVGSADKVDTSARTALVSPSPLQDGAPPPPRTLTYDQLVVATGSRSTTSSVPWKVLDSHDETVASLGAARERVLTANHIVVAGAGATGVEVAGELGFEYGGVKEVHLLSARPRAPSWRSCASASGWTRGSPAPGSCPAGGPRSPSWAARPSRRTCTCRPWACRRTAR